MACWQRYFVPGVTLWYYYCFLPRRLGPPTRTLKNTAEICFVTQTHALSTSLCTEGKHHSPGQIKTSPPYPPFLWERWAETKVNIFEKSERKKQNKFFKSHSFSLIGMLLAEVLQRKLLLEWKTLNETHVMWDFNSLELGKVKESGPYTLGLFSLATRNVYAIGFSHFIRSPLHLLDIVDTNQLKLILKSY